jgi:hypothetical protein
MTNADLNLIAAVKHVAEHPRDLDALTNVIEAALNVKRPDLAIAILHLHLSAQGFDRILIALKCITPQRNETHHPA